MTTRVLLVGHAAAEAEVVARLLEREGDASVRQARTAAELDQALRVVPPPDVGVTIHEGDGMLSRDAADRFAACGITVVVRADVLPARAADAYLRAGVAACVATGDVDALPQAVAEAVATRERARLAACRSVAAKMEAIHRFARRVSHDFNNIFGTVLTTVELMSRDTEGGVRPEDVTEIRDHIKRAAAFARQLVTFPRGPATDTPPLVLNDGLAGPVERLRQAAGTSIHVELHLAGDLWPVLADRSQVEQVVTLLLDNARDALPDGGRVVIETANVELGWNDGEAHSPDVAARFVRLVVSDTGAGLDPTARDRLFEPFFTTKQRPSAFDRGLTVVYGLVRQAGGFVHGTGRLGQGATFVTYFPAAEPMRDGPANRGP